MAPPQSRTADRPRPVGLGQHEPLNANERFKKDDDGLNVRARIENVYARDGFGGIQPDLRSHAVGGMRWGIIVVA